MDKEHNANSGALWLVLVAHLVCCGGAALLHCCARFEPAQIFQFSFDILSFDCTERGTAAKFMRDPLTRAFVAQGGRICWGCVPTTGDSRFDPVAFANELTAGTASAALSRSFVSASCGFGLITVGEAEARSMLVRKTAALLSGITDG